MDTREMEFEHGRVQCESCRMWIRVTVFPWSPQQAKVECPRCEYQFEVTKTTNSAMDQMEEMVEEHKEDLDRHAKAPEFSKDLGNRETIRTPLGDAYLIG
jgi:hypothetical protein